MSIFPHRNKNKPLYQIGSGKNAGWQDLVGMVPLAQQSIGLSGMLYYSIRIVAAVANRGFNLLNATQSKEKKVSFKARNDTQLLNLSKRFSLCFFWSMPIY